jgi:hypothetical protein
LENNNHGGHGSVAILWNQAAGREDFDIGGDALSGGSWAFIEI